MKISMLAVAAWLALGALQASAAPQGNNDNTPIKQDAKGVGSGAKDLGKNTGKLVGNGTKKGLNKAAGGLGKAADKLKKKTNDNTKK